MSEATRPVAVQEAGQPQAARTYAATSAVSPLAPIMSKQTEGKVVQENNSAMLDRREILKAGVGLLAAPLLASAATGAQAEQKGVPVGTGPFSARAYGATSATSPLGPLQIQRRALGPNDVLLDVLYCGICHSDIHQARDEWNEWGPTVYPCVPGHEIISRVVAVGNKVTKFKVGDIGGVGCMVDSCRTCDNCRADREQNCAQIATFTYNSPDKHGTAPVTYGGYSDKIVVTEHFVSKTAILLLYKKPGYTM